MFNIPRRLRGRLMLSLFSALVILNLLYLFLPFDSPLRLAITFNTSRLANFVYSKSRDREAWLKQDGKRYAVQSSDVAYLLKTGYGTKQRIGKLLDAYAMAGDLLGGGGGGGGVVGDQIDQNRLVVVGDWTTANHEDVDAFAVPIHDAVRIVIDEKINSVHHDHPRLAKYKTLQVAIESGNQEEALRIGADVGWELDALKFITGMELLFKQKSDAKWYVILDDDTFVIKSSLLAVLSHLNPEQPHYIGNAVGDYKARFAHGGSGVVLSGAAMRHLFDKPDIVAEAYLKSLDVTWGDKLVATTFQKLGIYLDEQLSHYFNGDSPLVTHISADRFCSPILSFHGLRGSEEMRGVGIALRGRESPVLWGQLWDLFGTSRLNKLADTPIAIGHDHVGRRDERTKSWGGISSSEACSSKCGEYANNWCLAWAFDIGTQECHASPWMIIGTSDNKKTSSGVIWSRISPMIDDCQRLYE